MFALTVKFAMFTLMIAVFIMILVTTFAFTLRVASALALLTAFALTLLKGFFNFNKMLKRMSEFFKDRF